MTRKKTQTTKTTPNALKHLRLIAAITGEKQQQIYERVLEKEFKTLAVQQGILTDSGTTV